MCLIVKENATGQIAEKNIPCYKKLYSDNRSTSEGFLYKKNIVNKKVNLLIRNRETLFSENQFIINRGYHSWNEKSIEDRCREHLFVIPKEAKYYVGGENKTEVEDGYVSETIIFVGKNNVWNRFWAKVKYGVTFLKP